jgi:hypothetical protein
MLDRDLCHAGAKRSIWGRVLIIRDLEFNVMLDSEPVKRKDLVGYRENVLLIT